MTYQFTALTTSNGQTRFYLHDWQERLLGLEIDRYKSGNISSASLAGKAISNSEAARIMSGELWTDGSGAWHLDHWTGRDMTAAQVLDLVAAAIDRDHRQVVRTHTSPPRTPTTIVATLVK